MIWAKMFHVTSKGLLRGVDKHGFYFYIPYNDTYIIEECDESKSMWYVKSSLIDERFLKKSTGCGVNQLAYIRYPVNVIDHRYKQTRNDKMWVKRNSYVEMPSQEEIASRMQTIRISWNKVERASRRVMAKQGFSLPTVHSTHYRPDPRVRE